MSPDPQQLDRALVGQRPSPLGELLPDPFVLPHYAGRSLCNLPPTIGQLLGVTQGWVAPPLEAACWQPLADGVERVLLLLLDGVGWRRLWSGFERLPASLEWLTQRGALLHPLTSVAPSTTSVALTTLWCNGAAPAEHGLLGYTFLLAERGALCNLLFWYPVGHERPQRGELEQWGLQPESFLPVPSIAQRLAEGAVSTTAFLPAAICGSPLSRLQMRGARVQGYQNGTDLWLQLQSWLAQGSGQRAYGYAYYPDFDTFSHRDGPDAPSWDALWQTLHFELTRFVEGLSQAQRRKTLLLISADHGLVTTPRPRYHLLHEHPMLAQQLLLPPGGEPRHLYLYVRAGQRATVRDYCEQELGDAFLLLESQAALEAGLYGPPERLHPDATRRLGDFILLARDDATLWHREPSGTLLGMHGALLPEEMLLPLIALRLDND